jgi:YbgC/YbaW family acyl-CoA thioester hydrolase
MYSTASQTELWSDAIVRYRDCDAYGHLHNTRYADYFLDAREDHLREHYGLDPLEHAKMRGQGWFVTQTQLRHFSPASAGEQVKIATRLFDFDRKKLDVEGRMYGSNGELRALVWWRFRAVDMKTGRPGEHDDEFMALCDRVVMPLPEPSSFEGRSKAVDRRL